MLALCGLFWSTAGVLIVMVDMPSPAIWSVRSGIAALVLAAIVRPSWRDLAPAEWVAACALAATTGLFVMANKLTTPANALLIQYSAPVWVALLGNRFLGERTRAIDWIAIVLVIGGVTLVFVDGLELDHTLGNFVAFLAGIAYATSVIAYRKVAIARPDAGPMRAMILGHAIAAVVGAPWLAASPMPDLDGALALLGLGLVQQVAATLCYAAALRHASAMEAMLVPVIEPVLSPIWVALAFGLLPGPWALVGGVIVIGAVVARGLAPVT